MRLNGLLFLLFTIVCATLHAGNGFAIKTVVIDAGHGGKDPGAIGPGNINEKDIALAVALKLGDYIHKNFPDVNVIYTRKTDVFVELHERADIANKNKADLFIAIHCNSSTSPSVYGTSTYVLGLHRTEANLEVAKRENAVILLEDDRDKNYEFDPNSPEGNIIMSMRQNAFLDQSIDIASKIESEYEGNAKRKSLGVKQAGFYVIYKTAMPSLLSEIGFISNPAEEKFLASAKGQDEIAGSIFKAFKDYKFEMENSEGEQNAYEAAKRKVESTADTSSQVSSSASVKPGTTAPANVSTSGNSTSTAPAAPTDADNMTVTLLSGRKIKKPIDNASGGGIAPDLVKPAPAVNTGTNSISSDSIAPPKPTMAIKSAPKPVTVDTSSAPVVENKEPTAPPQPEATKPLAEVKKVTPQPQVTQPAPEVKKVTPGKSGGATIKADTVVKAPSKPVTKPQATVKPEEQPVAVVKPEKKPVEVVSKPAVKPVADNSSNGVMAFKVQLIALKGPMKPSEVTKVTKALGEITNETITTSGLIRYYSGNSKTYTEAKKKAIIAAEIGYKDAFIVGFKNGVRFGPEKLKPYENQ